MSDSEFAFEIFNDRALLSSLPKELFCSMKEKGLIPHGSVYVHFCGLITYASITAIFLPRNSKISSSLKRPELARNLLKAIQRYKLSADAATETADNGKEIVGSDSISLIVKLLDDFVLNGIYAQRIEEHRLNLGKTDWKRTINQRTAFIISDSVFYPDVIGSRKLVDQNSDISRIHAQIVREICNKAGWIAFPKPDVPLQELSSIPSISYGIETQIQMLNRELYMSYSDRDISLLKGLIQYLEKKRGDDSSDLVIGIRECHGFWERMLDCCLMHKESVNHRLLAPLFKISGNYILASAKGQRTDTVLKHPTAQKYVIVDAKYYSAHNVRTSPQLSDIVKQFYYAKAMSILVDNVEDITNIFIFPGKSGNIQSIHMAKKGQKKQFTESDCLDIDYPPIQCIYQDPIELIENYSKGRYLKDLTQKLLKCF
ncbi:LlaJI family restriction endonuclease [Shewanella sp. DC2-4]|uniref:LlaJI family restriction endonuclease n=1 Tax=Shewanella sp. DC2-4 TaxID=2739431 RepID=UPI001567B256|nr:LlaJI family restriction endonuclease [Shewanella sp. DC2-4]NRD30664.1 LlaJI family restriction endonuclease [Shewanella sp. DC2-4]